MPASCPITRRTMHISLAIRVLNPTTWASLARPIPRRWRLPTVATTAVGRNWAVFTALCKRGLRDTDRELEAVAYRLADEARLKYPNSDLFPDSEVREILPLGVPISVTVARSGACAGVDSAASVSRAQERPREAGASRGTRREDITRSSFRSVSTRSGGVHRRLSSDGPNGGGSSGSLGGPRTNTGRSPFLGGWSCS